MLTSKGIIGVESNNNMVVTLLNNYQLIIINSSLEGNFCWSHQLGPVCIQYIRVRVLANSKIMDPSVPIPFLLIHLAMAV